MPAEGDPNVQGSEWHFYKQMYLVRKTEETLLSLFTKGMLTGTVHTCIGQEACAVGVVSALDLNRDVIWSNHRNHGHYLACFDDVEGLIAEIMGRESGICAGLGGSQHIHRDYFYTNGVLGGTIPCAVGSAFAEKRKNTGAITAVFLGDGAFGEGVVYESLNIAALWKLPVLFILEHNQYAQCTPTILEHAGDLSRRAEPFGIPSFQMTADDVMVVAEKAREVIEAVRKNYQPFFLVLHTYRFAPHSKGDDHRPPEEIEAHILRDPLKKLRNTLQNDDETRLVKLEGEIDHRLEAAVNAAAEAPFMQEQKFLEEAQRW
jgi:TPP-dependent pyruvate/acetoin dehydrogenase alpha subunit